MNEQHPRVDSVVVGGGIVGASAAYYLAKRGLRVRLLEKGRIGAEQSSRNWGAVRQQGRHRAELPIMMECNRLWQGLESELECSIDWSQQGQLRVAYDEGMMTASEDWLPVAREHGLDTRLVTPAELAELLPGFDASSCLGGMYTPSDGCAEPLKVTPAFARQAERLGVQVSENCAALAVDVADGRVCGVHTESGYQPADSVILASGAWTSRLLRPLGIRHPSVWVRASVAHTQALDFDMRKLVVWGKSAYRQHPDRTLTLAAAEYGTHDLMLDSLRYGWRFAALARRNRNKVRFSLGKPLLRDLAGGFGGFTSERTLDPTPDRDALQRAAMAFQQEYPGSPVLSFQRSWAGYIDFMPDELPVIDELRSPAGLFVAAGLSGHGFGLGPMVGNILAQLIATGHSNHDLEPFSAQRFA